MLRYNSKAWSIKYSTPKVKLIFAGIVTIFIGIVSALLLSLVYKFSLSTKLQILPQLQELEPFPIMAVLSGVLLIILGFIIGGYYSRHTHLTISCMVRKALFSYQYGNPLHLKDGERLPVVGCKKLDNGKYLLRVSVVVATAEEIQKLSSVISSAINKKKLNQYAVTITNSDVAFNFVEFTIEDVTVDRSLTFTDVSHMKQDKPTKLIVQDGTYIDLTTSGSVLCAGKTRSGKTTAIISILLQALLQKQDSFSSAITIIDPKQAELSQLPYVVTIDKNGEARQILSAIKAFAEIIKQRQKVLNELAVRKGDVVKWWEAGMHPSFVFIDEYVACRTLFPKKADKGSDYCLTSFDSLLKRIATMGASSGCFLILSVAEASVEEAGVPSMIKNAMSTKLLFKPTLSEARLIWSKDKLENFSVNRVYNAGDCWFSSTDGKHDDVSYVHFPIMKFPVYRELGRLLTEYYNE